MTTDAISESQVYQVSAQNPDVFSDTTKCPCPLESHLLELVLSLYVNASIFLVLPEPEGHSGPLAYLQLPGLRFQGHNRLLCPRILTSPNASCIHGVWLLWREQPAGGAGGGGLLAQGLVQTGYGQRSACKSHPQALPPGLPGLEQNGNACRPWVPS